MSDWVSQAEISARLGYKILLAGLSEAGKTAVKRIFFLKQTTADVDNLGATINYERMTMNIKDVPVTIVDLGGQKVFLKRFLSNFSPFVFSSVRTFLFLIDVANKTSRNSAIQYFCACLERLAKFSPSANVFVFLHKNDLVRNSPNYESIHQQLKEQFQLEYKNGDLPFFRTTIYSPETVIDSFGRIFELSAPEIAESEFVDNKKIGAIEEYIKESMVIRQEVKPVERIQMGGTPQDELPLTPYEAKLIKQSTTTPFTDLKTVGKTDVLAKLQNLMRDAVTIEEPKKADDAVLSKLKNLLELAVKPEGTEQIQLTVKPPDVMRINEEPVVEETRISESLSDDAISSKIPVIEELPITPQLEEKTEDIPFIESEKENQITHLVSFYNVERSQATNIIDLGYKDLFESVATTSAVEIPLIIDVLLKYLPLISQQVDVSNLKQSRLFNIFFAIMKGDLQRENLAECLILAAKSPDLTINEVIEKLTTEEVRKPEEALVQKPIKRYETAQLEVPLRISNDHGVISIPEIPSLGFKCILVNSNVQLEFQNLSELEKHRRIFGRTTVSSTIKTSELTYLLTYELNLFSLGFFDGKDQVLELFARLIYSTIQKMKDTNQTSSEGLESNIDFNIPISIELDGNFILIPDSQSASFTIKKATRGFNVIFKQDKTSLGNVQIEMPVNLSSFVNYLRERVQLPLKSEDAWDLATRIIYGALNTFKQAS